MRIDLTKSRSSYLIFALALICLLTGGYHIYRCVLISYDSVNFLNFAKSLDTDFLGAIKANFQHPGYSVTIWAASKIVQCESNIEWIHLAQWVTLIFRMISIILFYLIGKHVLKDKSKAFLASFIYAFLAVPTKFGSDVLSDWPAMTFLMASVFVFIKFNHKYWGYLLIGLLAGLGYLYRPENILFVFVVSCWLFIQFIVPFRYGSRVKVVIFLLLAVMSAAAMAGPYMYLKGKPLPKKPIEISLNRVQDLSPEKAEGVDFLTIAMRVVKAVEKFTKNAFDNFSYFWLIPYAIGFIYYFKKRKFNEPEYFVFFLFCSLYFLLLVWLYCKHGYMSKRHTLPFFTLTSFFMAIGLECMDDWFKNRRKMSLFLIFAVCFSLFQLYRPIRTDKISYLQASNWLYNNTLESSSVYSPESRIAFYAQRKDVFGLEPVGICEFKADYLVKIYKSGVDAEIKDSLYVSPDTPLVIVFGNGEVGD